MRNMLGIWVARFVVTCDLFLPKLICNLDPRAIIIAQSITTKYFSAACAKKKVLTIIEESKQSYLCRAFRKDSKSSIQKHSNFKWIPLEKQVPEKMRRLFMNSLYLMTAIRDFSLKFFFIEWYKPYEISVQRLRWNLTQKYWNFIKNVAILRFKGIFFWVLSQFYAEWFWIFSQRMMIDISSSIKLLIFLVTEWVWAPSKGFCSIFFVLEFCEFTFFKIVFRITDKILLGLKSQS